MSYNTPRTRAVLGSTNTGKTHLACTRMLGHQSGIIGLPLRLLAREIYDRTIAGHFGRVHPADVALITGEERIIPPNPRYYICTSESMPTQKKVAFVALDECQLASDRERGHIFTDRILYMRGTAETLFLGAATMAPLLKHLLPDIEIETRQRFSQLTYTPPRKLSRLPPRSAIIAFSANDVYAIADIMRRHHGGVGVVMGSLSPRTRNAQVAMYQSGEVDYLVATDAIGMGLNMDIDHIAFARTRKFDGKQSRPLTAAELAQIAGRAGRHKTNGTFSFLADADPIDAETILRIETHDFEPVKNLMWRTRNLDFTSLAALITSLEQPPTKPYLTRALTRTQGGDDLQALKRISRDRDITDETSLRQLWQIAQLPDYRKTTQGAHSDLIQQIFTFCETGGIPDSWMSEQIKHCDRRDGDIDALATRLAHIRTCTYIAHHTDWIKNTPHPNLATDWQEVSQAVEARLSDNLHAQLMGKFVDRKNATLLRHLAEHNEFDTHISDTGDISLSGQMLGTLKGLRIIRTPALAALTIAAARIAFDKAAQKALTQKAHAIIQAPNKSFSLSSTLSSGEHLLYEQDKCATLYIPPHSHNHAYLTPQLRLLADAELGTTLTQKITSRLTQWINDYSTTHLAPLHQIAKADNLNLTSASRGLIFRLLEQYGNLPRREVQSIIAKLDPKERRTLRTFGIRIGYYNIYMPDLLKAHAAFFLAQTYILKASTSNLPQLPNAGITSAERSTLDTAQDTTLDTALYRANGFHPTRHHIIRFDILERVAHTLRPYAKEYAKTKTAFAIRPTDISELLSRLGCRQDTLVQILTDLGYTHLADKTDALYFTPPFTHANTQPHSKKRPKKKPPLNSAFAALRTLQTSNNKKHNKKPFIKNPTKNAR